MAYNGVFRGGGPAAVFGVGAVFKESSEVIAVGNFCGGVHPHDHKETTRDKEITDLPAPEVVVVPLSQHIGAPAKALVARGDEVLRGQPIGEPGGFVSAPVHAPVTGKVKRITAVAHPLGRRGPAVEIERSDSDDVYEGVGEEFDWRSASPDDVKQRVSAGGIVGMGGATFPTHVKLSPPDGKPIDTVIINGAECEPYLSADHRLMLEEPGKIVEGLEILLHILGARRGILAIEGNKPEAIKIMRSKVAVLRELDVAALEVKYPQGAEKQQIKSVLDREVPRGGLPMDVGVVVQNVATAAAVTDAVAFTTPLIRRVVTVAGSAIENPANYRAWIGTPISALLDAAGRREGANKLIMGGPMMGIAQWDDQLPVTKGTSGVLLVSGAKAERAMTCIRCGRCIDRCPMGIMPASISRLAEVEAFDDCPAEGILDCIECGVCSFVCPSKRPIVQQVKLGKAHLARKRAQEQARAEASAN